MSAELQVFMWFILGAACLLSGNILRNKHQRLAQDGKSTTGIVTSVIDDSWRKIFGDRGIYHYSIRFVTDDKRWISKSYTTLLNDLERHYREGEKIDILYNSTDPEEFIVGSSPGSLGPKVFMLIGIGFICYSVWILLNAVE
ncbi:DUF3592 domain-containing protein [Hymenobacter sp. UYP22]|uniref:DUF3592 domain-containing protein n=1 Tax=Hymenobacter sp. UYP22 TaxID=3156348 RepID=UPI0033923620